MKRTLIIAEAGVNHNGDLAKAKALIDKGAEAGVDRLLQAKRSKIPFNRI